MHWGTFPVLAQSSAEFAKELAKSAPACRFVSIAPGESITLPLSE
jgi:L-ascorbate metabolism protein UlaG (beta-lactamase superfamily)